MGKTKTKNKKQKKTKQKQKKTKKKKKKSGKKSFGTNFQLGNIGWHRFGFLSIELHLSGPINK